MTDIDHQGHIIGHKAQLLFIGQGDQGGQILLTDGQALTEQERLSPQVFVQLAVAGEKAHAEQFAQRLRRQKMLFKAQLFIDAEIFLGIEQRRSSRFSREF